jgi:hypothetical protein
MAMQKKGDEQKVEVLRGREANVLHSHMEHTGKTSLSRFSDSEMEELNRDLETARREEAAEQARLLEELQAAEAEHKAEAKKSEDKSV